MHAEQSLTIVQQKNSNKLARESVPGNYFKADQLGPGTIPASYRTAVSFSPGIVFKRIVGRDRERNGVTEEGWHHRFNNIFPSHREGKRQTGFLCRCCNTLTTGPRTSYPLCLSCSHPDGVQGRQNMRQHILFAGVLKEKPLRPFQKNRHTRFPWAFACQ